jgi:hypothetical protein
VALRDGLPGSVAPPLRLTAWSVTAQGERSMPRYHFDRYEGPRFVPNDEGSEFEGPDAAESNAAELAAQIGWDPLPKGDDRKGTTEVRNERARRMLTETVSRHADQTAALSVAPGSRTSPRADPLEPSIAGILATARLLS